MVKNPPANAAHIGSVILRKIPWRRKWQPTPVFLPGNPMDREAWQATVIGLEKSDTTIETKQQQQNNK